MKIKLIILGLITGFISGFFGSGGGLILVPIVSLLTQKTLPKNIDEKFSCYDVEVVTNKKDSLG